MEALRQIKSIDKFSEAAYRYSAAPTKALGKNYMAKYFQFTCKQGLVSGLSIGEVTEPLSIPGGVALFQLRNIREVKAEKSKTEIIDFLEFEFESNIKIEHQ